MSYTSFARARRADAEAGRIVSKSTACTTCGRKEAIRRKAYHHHRGRSAIRSGWPSGARRWYRWTRTPSRVSSAGNAHSRSQRTAWTSYPARASVAASLATRGSMPAGLFDRTKTTRAAMSSQIGRHGLRDLQPSRTVPEWIRPIAIRVELPTDGIADPFRIRPREDVRSDFQRFRPLRVLSKRDAGDAEEATLLLKTTRVCHHERRVLFEDQHVEIPGRFDALQRRLGGGPFLEAEFAQPFQGPRMNREEDRQARLVGRPLERNERPCQPFFRIDVLRAVERQQEVAARLQAETRQDVGPFLRYRAVLQERVEHAVADDVDALRHVLASQILPRGGRRSEEEVRELVRDDAVDLLGHRLVERPDARFDVRERTTLLARQETAGERRVRVAVDDHEVGVFRDGRNLSHGRRDLQVRRSRLQLELMIRLPQFQVAEEDPIHHDVVVLPRMDEDVFVVQRIERLDHRRHLDDLRPGADDRDDATHRTGRGSERGPIIKIVPHGAMSKT